MSSAAALGRQQQVHIDFAKTLDVMGVGVRRATSFMSLGLQVAETDGFPARPLEDDLQWHFMPDPLPASALNEAKVNFGEWVIGGALKELDQHCSLFLDAVYKALTLTSFHGRRIDQASITRFENFANETNVAVKLKRVSDEFGIEVKLRDHLAGLSKARNALTHNMGFVSKRHLTSATQLELTWRAMDLVVGGNAHKHPFSPVHVEKGGEVQMQVVTREKQFALGERVAFTRYDLNEICWNYWDQAVAITKGSEALPLD